MRTTDNYYYSITNYILKEALSQADLLTSDNKLKNVKDKSRVGLAIGSMIAHIGQMEEFRGELDAGRWLPLSPYGYISQIMKEYEIEGYQGSNANACSATLILVGDAYRMIRDGYQDIILAGGMDINVNAQSHIAFDRVGAVAKSYDDPRSAVRPFDEDRSGTCPGDGGAIMVVESLEHAKARGANILAEVVGYDTASYGGDLFKPSERGIQKIVSSTLY